MLKVTCAIIIKEGRILVTQRSEQMKHPLKWEFPGGKLNQNESEEDCIRREIKEELDIEISVIRKLSPQYFDYGDKQIFLLPFIAEHFKGTLKLTEHRDYKWADKPELRNFDWVQADVLVVEEFLKL